MGKIAMSDETCAKLIADMESRGWKCDVNDENRVGFVFHGDETQEWIRDYNKKTGTFVQFNGKQKVNLIVTDDSDGN